MPITCEMAATHHKLALGNMFVADDVNFYNSIFIKALVSVLVSKHYHIVLLLGGFYYAIVRINFAVFFINNQKTLHWFLNTSWKLFSQVFYCLYILGRETLHAVNYVRQTSASIKLWLDIINRGFCTCYMYLQILFYNTI